MSNPITDFTITGKANIGGEWVPGAGGSFHAYDPVLRQTIGPAFHMVDAAQIDRACRLAQSAFDPFRALSDARRATFLDAIGAEIMQLGDTLVERVMAESGLPRARIEGERGRTVGQLKLFAELLREGSWCDPRIDSALPQRQPPRPDLRLRMIGLGPVAVFAASNFPLAFSVAGGDTAAAFAAGCPVLVKAHSAHPGTSELVAGAIVRAAELCEMPRGVFSLITGSGNGIGQELVRHPAVQAVGFTGSRQGGLALMGVAAARPPPIPVYAEMSSINPFVLLPQALAARAEEIATGFAASLTMGVGQFCTNPGLVLALDSPDLDRFTAKAAEALAAVPCGTMLTAGIAESYQRGVAHLAQHDDVQSLGQIKSDEGKGGAALFRTGGAAFLARADLREEVFGPASLVVACRDAQEMAEVIESLEGQLTATLQLDAGDMDLARRLLPLLERRVGRILANGFPTGVEVSTAMVHGGPFPATSDGRSTSVGTAAIQRFLRPVCYQNLPMELLPPVLRDDDAPKPLRRRDGVLK
ncbi:MAG TPA: aldehyde dehydrogenase (NADP(+)) [Burkholderiaceae bacterium]